MNKNNTPAQKAQWLANRRLGSSAIKVTPSQPYAPPAKTPSRRDAIRAGTRTRLGRWQPRKCPDAKCGKFHNTAILKCDECGTKLDRPVLWIKTRNLKKRAYVVALP